MTSPAPPVGPGRRSAAVLGSPIAHSLSPVLHRAAYVALGLADWTYRAIECTEAELDATLHELDAEGLAGVSLTMPLKRAVMPGLAEVDRWARLVGAANTVVFGDGGFRSGANTDVPGMVAALRTAGLRPGSCSRAVLIGAGATAAAALAAVATIGSREVIVVARRPEAASDLTTLAALLGIDCEVRDWSELASSVDAPLVIATTPAGATDALAGGLTTVTGLLFDVVYAPWPTLLAAAWTGAGGRIVGGLDLLVAQAAEQVRLMTGLAPPVAQMHRAGAAALARQHR